MAFLVVLADLECMAGSIHVFDSISKKYSTKDKREQPFATDVDTGSSICVSIAN
jgi:hypothetical protein